MIDSHCHLYEPHFTTDEIHNILETMEQRGIKCISVSETVKDISRVMELASTFPNTYIAFVGIHPIQSSESVTVKDLDLQILEDMIKSHAVGIGEIGLDFSPHVVCDPIQKEEQIKVFRLQLELAKKYNVFVNVHSRQAGHYVIDIMSEMGMEKVILHAFDGKLKYARKAVECGWLFSIPGSVQREIHFQKLVSELPLHCLILESDAPALGPIKGVKASPLDLEGTAEYVAKLKRVTAEELLCVPSGKHLKLFERSNGDYYSVHGDDALFIADSFYNTSTVLKYYDGSVPSCSLSQLNALAVMKDLLLVQGYRVEIWKCENKDWKLSKQASPGNLKDVEEINSEVSSSPVVMAVKVETVDNQKMVGVALTDATTSRSITISEFIDNEAFSNLESLLVQQSIKECIIPDDSQNLDFAKVKQVLDKCEVVCTLGPKSMFNSKNIAQDLNRLVESELDIQTMPEFEMKIAMSATAAIISYLSLLDDESNLNAYQLCNHNLSQYMKLDAAAVKALNLTPAPNEGNKNMNLYGLLNRCQTSQGSRLLSQWIKQPLMNIADIKKRQDFVEAFVTDSSLRQDLHSDILKKFPDLHRLGKKFQRGKALLQDVLRVYQVVLVLPVLIGALKNYEGEYNDLINEEFVKKFAEYASSLENLKNMVETTIDLRAADNHEYLIKADFHEGLKELKSKMDSVFDQLEPEARKVANRLGVEMDKKLKFENNSQFGYHLRLSRTDAAKIRGIKEYIELRTVKAGVQFTTIALRRLSEDYNDLQKEYGVMQSSIAKEVITVTGSYFPILENLNRLIAELDVFVSFAHIAIHAPIQYTRPQLEVEGNIIMKGARHPCVEVQDDVSFIENNVEMVRDESMFHIITGPNMGGKSTFIRQIGVVCLMAQIGCFVPCEEATISITDSILARVGAGDSQLKSISTFMAEMLETASILRSATPKSLIIIDELGRGTSTKDGYGLAKAIAEYIATELQCFTLFATHFHEITELESKIMTVTNYHVEAHLSEINNEKLLTLLYKVKKGPCDQSFGIHVAELAQFPLSCIKMAKRKAIELEGFETTTKKIKSDGEGSKIILEMLKEVKNLKKDELSKVGDIVEKYDLSNEYIQSILVEL
ncbi:MutS-like protein [Boothiomyces sp. JEL0866]|nr:MutS-like protein [Boothiomyces sp. JEL0866]KAJ3325212.1 MutS-like protein [Boothiomyces sp. JEL0866]